MSFVVDLVSEDSFYVNLLLGLYKVLSKHQQITDVKLKRFAPCEKAAVTNWEMKNGVSLPSDMRKFYLSTDGFCLTWDLKYAGQQIPVGNLYIRPLAEVTSISFGSNDFPNSPPITDKVTPSITTATKIFDLDLIKKATKMFLIYDKPDLEAKFWIFDPEFGWSLITESFTKYFRMMLVHHGLPQWQFCLIPKPFSSWVEEIYMLIAPHLLRVVKKRNKSNRETYIPELPHNHIDPVIFTADPQMLPRRYGR